MPLTGSVSDVEQPAQLAAQLVHARTLRDAEHRAQDDLKRHRLHARAQRDMARRAASARSPRRRRRPSARRSAACARRGTPAASACAGCRCGSSSSSSTESGPSTGSRMRFASPACNRRGSPVNTCLIVSGSRCHDPRAFVGDPQREHLAEPRLSTDPAATARGDTRSPLARPAACAARAAGRWVWRERLRRTRFAWAPLR